MFCCKTNGSHEGLIWLLTTSFCHPLLYKKRIFSGMEFVDSSMVWSFLTSLYIHGVWCIHRHGIWFHSVSTRVSHHCGYGSIPAACSYLTKVTSSHVRIVLSSLTQPSTAGFLQSLRFPPEVKVDSRRVTINRPLGRTA